MANFIITAGGNKEPIDKVRSIVNSSRGGLGVCLAAAVLANDIVDVDRIYYLIGPGAVEPAADDRIELLPVDNARELEAGMSFLLREHKIDYVLHAMAVSDYYPAGVLTKQQVLDGDDPKAVNKVSSAADELYIRLRKNPKVIDSIKKDSPDTTLLGFKLLYDVNEEELYRVGHDLLTRTNADYVFANDLHLIKSGQPHSGILIDDEGGRQHIGGGKEQIASAIVDRVLRGRS